MLVHQDGSTHEWVPRPHWDLIVTLDDATNEHYSMFFGDEEGTQSSFRGVREVLEACGLFSAFHSDRGSHYWTTPEARGRSERAFATHQGRLPKELALVGITDMEAANRYLRDVYRPAFNVEFAQPAAGRRFGIRAFPGRKFDRYPVRAIRTHRRQGQLRAFRRSYAANSQRPAPLPLR